MTDSSTETGDSWVQQFGIPGLSDEDRDRLLAALKADNEFTLPRLNLSPIDPIDEAAQAWPGKTDSEITAMQAEEPAWNAPPEGWTQEAWDIEVKNKGIFKAKGDAHTAAALASIPKPSAS